MDGLPLPLEHDALLPYLSDATPLGRHIKHHIQQDGYVVLPSILTKEECSVELSRLWDFVEATAPGVSRHDPNSWYPPPLNTSYDNSNHNDNNDPWPHSGWNFLPDMLQSFQAGWLFGHLRELLAERIFEPLFNTRELHSSKEGFTFHRPTAPGVASNGATHPVLTRERPRVCGKVQSKANGEHFDQCAAHTGLHCIQSSTSFLDQDANGSDGCFQCWPRSHLQHATMTKDIWRGRSDWVPLTDDELNMLETLGLQAKKVPVKAGDVILWRSDLVHCGLGPSLPYYSTGFRAVSYTAMIPAAMSMQQDVYQRKLEEYLTMATGDHRPNVKSRHFAQPKKEKSQGRTGIGGTGNGKNDDDSHVKLARGKYFSDGPPVLTLRQAELYGLVPYNSNTSSSDNSGDCSSIISSQIRLCHLLDNNMSGRDGEG